ncbi:MAG: hypothetical protein EBZ69_05550 [Alphaproteobacteria bacterium]|nr:hypothetical protein [Alphaproteobacteria bacterium]
MISPLTNSVYGQPLAAQYMKASLGSPSGASEGPRIIIPAPSRTGVDGANSVATETHSADTVSTEKTKAAWEPVTHRRHGDDLAPKDVVAMGFDDFIDMVNPLHHIPVVGDVYRSITGDQIKPVSRVMGAALFGGLPGAVGAIAKATYLQANQPTQLANADPAGGVGEKSPIARTADAGGVEDVVASAAPSLNPSSHIAAKTPTHTPMISAEMDAALRQLAQQPTPQLARAFAEKGIDAAENTLPGIAPVASVDDLLAEVVGEQTLSTAQRKLPINPPPAPAQIDGALAKYRTNTVALNTTMPVYSGVNVVR